MTTNEQRAAEVIHRTPLTTGRLIQRQHAKLFARALADAGLLAPDLPEPEALVRFPGSDCWQLAPYRGPHPSPHVAVRIDHQGRIKVNLSGEIDSQKQLREAAAALLAAAQHAEGEA